VNTSEGVFARGRVVVNKRTTVRGWIKSLDSIIVESRAVVESLSAPRVVLEHSVRAQNVYAEELEIEDNVAVSGDFAYTMNLRADRSDRVNSWQKQPQKVESIPSDKKWIA